MMILARSQSLLRSLGTVFHENVSPVLGFLARTYIDVMTGHEYDDDVGPRRWGGSSEFAAAAAAAADAATATAAAGSSSSCFPTSHQPSFLLAPRTEEEDADDRTLPTALICCAAAACVLLLIAISVVAAVSARTRLVWFSRQLSVMREDTSTMQSTLVDVYRRIAMVVNSIDRIDKFDKVTSETRMADVHVLREDIRSVKQDMFCLQREIEQLRSMIKHNNVLYEPSCSNGVYDNNLYDYTPAAGDDSRACCAEL